MILGVFSATTGKNTIQQEEEDEKKTTVIVSSSSVKTAFLQSSLPPEKELSSPSFPLCSWIPFTRAHFVSKVVPDEALVTLPFIAAPFPRSRGRESSRFLPRMHSPYRDVDYILNYRVHPGWQPRYYWSIIKKRRRAGFPLRSLRRSFEKGNQTNQLSSFQCSLGGSFPFCEFCERVSRMQW